VHGVGFDALPPIWVKMTAAEIRQQFLDFFNERGHQVPELDDIPTVTCCYEGLHGLVVRHFGPLIVVELGAWGGKHNDLEEVGRTTRHHTFFEMLGNFSFGDYFKQDAIRFAWDLMTDVYGLDPARLYATVHHSDEEAAGLWVSEVGLDPARIFRLGDKDNFWQMADTGPCGPCSELHYDQRPEVPDDQTVEAFVAAGDRGDIVELWNLVITAVLQGVDSNYHTDLFMPLLERVGQVVGRPYDADASESVSYRVLADHARAVAFLLADGVFPSSEGRGYVLRRILRRGVRHAWLLGLRAPALVHVVEAVIDGMGQVYHELEIRREHLLKTTNAEEERFLATIEGGMSRFEELAPAGVGGGEIPGPEVFRLYDTYGFPLDLTQLMAEERGYAVDVEGFENELESQRARSRADRASAGTDLEDGEYADGWTQLSTAEQAFVGYEATSLETSVLAWRREGDVLGLILRENPFYSESGGQVSDGGEVRGYGWSLRLTDVRKIEGRSAVFGMLEGHFPTEPGGLMEVEASVPKGIRHDTERNHTATHLLHSALRSVLGEHVVQRGSLVAPDRLRFDFAHTAPMTADERDRVEAIVNEGIWADHPVETGHRSYEEAVGSGAMALFGEKYGDEVRVVHVPGVSMELCGGTHVRRTSEIGLFRLVGESGVASGVRRVEALTGPGAYRHLREQEDRLAEAAGRLKTQPANLSHRVAQLLEERSELESLVDELRTGGGGAGEREVAAESLDLSGDASGSYRGIRLRARGAEDVRKWGDAFLSGSVPGVAVVGADLPGGKTTLFTFVTDDLISRGVRADAVVREIAALVGGRGGGKAHMAQAGVEEADRLDEALASGARVVRQLLEESAE
jgi:alanyl-tRNA synthetase